MIVRIKNIICPDLIRWMSTSSQAFLRLDQLIKYQKQQRIAQKIRKQDTNIFKYGQDPVKFKLELFGFFKYNYWETSLFAEQKLLNFVQIMNGNIGQLVNTYREVISTTRLPMQIGKSNIAIIYVQQLRLFLREVKILNMNQTNSILDNIQKILLERQTDLIFTNKYDSYWLFIDTIHLLLTKCILNIQLISPNRKGNMIQIAKMMKIKNYEFLEYLKNDVQKQYKDINLSYFLIALSYLSENKTFPYEFFYRQKKYLLDCISQKDDLSEKKLISAINMLEIFTKERLFYCEQILSKLFVILFNNLPCADTTQLIKIFFLTSKVKGGVDPDFIDATVARIGQFLEILDKRQYTLLVKSLVNLNYRKKDILQKVKSFNYEVFLTELTFGSQKLSQYYQNLLKQLQQQNEESDLRKISYEDSPFKPVEVENISKQALV